VPFRCWRPGTADVRIEPIIIERWSTRALIAEPSSNNLRRRWRQARSAYETLVLKAALFQQSDGAGEFSRNELQLLCGLRRRCGLKKSRDFDPTQELFETLLIEVFGTLRTIHSGKPANVWIAPEFLRRKDM
jgi:hypothetical protein